MYGVVRITALLRTATLSTTQSYSDVHTPLTVTQLFSKEGITAKLRLGPGAAHAHQHQLSAMIPP